MCSRQGRRARRLDSQHLTAGFTELPETKLNYRFHNPNSAEDTADFLCKLLIEANAGKVERATEKTALQAESEDYILENLSENKEKSFVW